jgi:hypothetical protein
MNNEAKGVLLKTELIATICFSLCVKLLAAGWFFFFGIFIYPFICLLHINCHYRFLHSPEPITDNLLRQISISHLLMIAAFLLQYDAGDNSVWLTITLLITGEHSGALSEGGGVIVSALVLYTRNYLVGIPYEARGG